MNNLDKIPVSKASNVEVASLRDKCYAAILDDLNSPILIAHLFDTVKTINSLIAGNLTISQSDLDELKSLMKTFVYDILGLSFEEKTVSK